MVEFKIVHISDLHFSAGTNPATNHQHSIAHLQGLESHLGALTFDRLIVSGDVSNNGDFESLNNAHQWLTNYISLGSGVTTGLRISDPRHLGVIPGNHDAFNAGSHPSLSRRWQSSLENYNNVFSNHAMPPRDGCTYDWLERDGAGIYIAYVDSCFLGDPGSESDPFSKIKRIAKGKMSLKQSHTLLENYDRGVRGNLPHPGGSESIDPASFASSLKILVMHHYLFPPPTRGWTGSKANRYLMKVHETEAVFRNLALADFDLLLCGHSHIADVHLTSYGKQFDRRARRRYMLNCFRRSIGIHSLPMQFETRGQRISKFASTLLGLLMQRGRTDQDYLSTFLELLTRSLREPDVLENEVSTFLQEHRETRDHELNQEELAEIRKRIVIALHPDVIPGLEKTASLIGEAVNAMKARPFLQIMNGSAAKSSSSMKKRCFNVYSIRKFDDAWLVHSDEYEWDYDKGAFRHTPFPRDQSFRKSALL